VATSDATTDAGAGPGLVVTCNTVTRWYRSATGPVHALTGVEGRFTPGRLHVVAGPSGSGKSTLLRILALLERPDEGRVEIGADDMNRLSGRARRRWRARRLTHLFQRPTDNLVDHLDAVGNLVLPAALRGVDVPDPMAVLDRFGLLAHARAHPSQLSGGEQQRLAVAAAFTARPAVLTADEPTAELDRASAMPVLEGLRALAEAGTTVIVSSHDPVVVDEADTVLTLRRPAGTA
jgi:ABC-type lipoprotein export system ATPase subunit